MDMIKQSKMQGGLRTLRVELITKQGEQPTQEEEILIQWLVLFGSTILDAPGPLKIPYIRMAGEGMSGLMGQLIQDVKESG